MLAIVGPASAIKIYVNPSIQTSNYSPDGTYQEGANMNDVASRLVDKLFERGFDVRNSGWTFSTVNAACDDARSWGANCFIAVHSNASAGSGWHATNGTTAYYLVNWSGYSSPGDIDIANRCQQKVKAKFGAWGRGGTVTSAWSINQGDVVWNGPGDHCLVEGLFHDNWDDLQVLKDPAGRDAYAQGLYEAVCDHYGMSYSAVKPAVGLAQDGRTEVFARGTDSGLWHKYELPGGGWSSMQSFAGLISSNPAVIRNADGTLQVFCVGSAGTLFTLYQTSPNGNWSGWYYFGPQTYQGDPAVIRDRWNTLNVFVRGTDNAIWQIYGSKNSWSAPVSLGGILGGSPAAIVNADSRMQVFAINPTGNLFTIYQPAVDSGFSSGWCLLGGEFQGTPAVSLSHYNSISLYARGMDNAIWNRFGTSNSWGAWTSLAGGLSSNPTGVMNNDSRLQAFAINSAGNLFTDYQPTVDSGWSGWQLMAGIVKGDAGAVVKSNGCIQLYCVGVGPSGALFQKYQSTPGGAFSDWVWMGGGF